MASVFMTGFPGFIGSALIERLLERYDKEVRIVCLVQPKFAEAARQKAQQLERAHPDFEGRIQLVEGDITLPDLGLGSRGKELQQDVVEIYHLAAIYDLAIRREPAMKVNVEGTRHVLQFAEHCPRLKRFQYTSTCYVSGRYPGKFTEQDLDKGQKFNNYYEETKFLAEVEVQRYMREGMPTTIYRPAIVVGDSRTGETQKYDGPYFVMQWYLRSPRIVVLPVPGNPNRYTSNIVPRDFVVSAMQYLSGIEASLNKVYQLCDPHPHTIKDLLEILARATRRKVVWIPMPKAVIKESLKHVPGMKQFMGIPPEAVDYFTHPTTYTCENTLRDLQGTGIYCPRFETYVDKLLAFMQAHPEIPFAGMY